MAVGGAIKAALAIPELRSLRPGDCAILTPVPVKNDPFAIFFGNHPIWLPFDAGDPYNTAFWLADLELVFPVAPADRRSLPLFPGDDADSPLAFSMADTIFHAVAVAGLGRRHPSGDRNKNYSVKKARLRFFVFLNKQKTAQLAWFNSHKKGKEPHSSLRHCRSFEAMLSLHSGRVFCACALLAKGAPSPVILALCRWRDERSLE